MKSHSEDHRTISIIGSIFIAIGIIFNEWTLGKMISHDGAITSFAVRIIIWAFNILSVLTGFVIIKYNFYIKTRWKEIMFIAVSFVLFLFILEGGMRVFYYIKGRNMDFSEYIGWQSKENQAWKKNIEGYGEIMFSTTEYGFRVFGNPNTHKIKIFVIGDSFTQGLTVSDGYTYYDYLKKNHKNIEIFAYGAGGYSSLQEYMILDKYFDMIRPDLILWQFCSNDIINNSHELESLSLYNNNHNTRPYYNYRNGQISMLYPQQFVGWADKIIQRSYLLKLASLRMGILKGEVSGSVEESLKEDDQLAKEVIQTTSAIMGLVRERAGKIPIVAFPVDNEQIKWSSDVFSDISRKYSIHYIDYVPVILEEARARGIAVDAPEINSHWNYVGHTIVGETILNYLIEHNLLTK